MTGAEKIIKIAGRYNNEKRSYLLVNEIQAKHVPTRPGDALGLFGVLGRKIKESYPEARFTIGFAETATAIAAQVAATIGGIYVNTTREDFIDEGDCICFREEHSHAVNQKLFVKNFADYLNGTAEIVLVDDEISTGRTLLNIIEAMRERIPELSERTFVVGSIVNRLTPERVGFFREKNIRFVSVYNVGWTDGELERDFGDVSAPSEVCDVSDDTPEIFRIHIPEARKFTPISDYLEDCVNVAEQVAAVADFSSFGRILFVGSEECMFPAIVCADIVGKKTGAETFTHSTTRSPVLVSSRDGYPMKNGYKIRSFYDSGRVNFIYNLQEYDAAVIVSDSHSPEGASVRLLDSVFRNHGIKKRFWFFGG